MKRILVTLILAIVIAGPVRADEEEPAPMAGVMFDPIGSALGLATGIFNVSIEIQVAIGDHIGLSVTPMFAAYLFDDAKVYGGGLELGPRILVTGNKLAGVYIYPLVSFAWATGSRESTGETVSGGGILAGMEIGYTWAWESGFMLSLGGGVGYMKFVGNIGGRTPDPQILPRFRLCFGYGW
ncbi:MAG: hypothetical protein JRJ19_13640 [Deltaproteobacteria bacterium]|nr:hypothetical protein [Deltaproteobacteria bacterium]MBW1873106.1 hypothetical protein [Deltaproteobacteria bacterium]